MSNLVLTRHDVREGGFRIAKAESEAYLSIYKKLHDLGTPLGGQIAAASSHVVYYQEACRYWVKAMKGEPYFRRNGQLVSPPHGRTLRVINDVSAAFAACVLNSSHFYWYYSLLSDCEHINDALLRSFPAPSDWEGTPWEALWTRLSGDLETHARRKRIQTKQGHAIEYDEFSVAMSKPIIDEIDVALGKHYRLTAAELDLIINYDIKYRMGQDGEE